MELIELKKQNELLDNYQKNFKVKLKKEKANFYYYEPNNSNYTIHFYKISRNCWGMCFDNGATKETFKSLKECRDYIKNTYAFDEFCKKNKIKF